jgi:hypothetical protein
LDVRRNRERLMARELRPKCFVIAPSMLPGRETLLREQNIHWIRSDSQKFSEFLEAAYQQPLSNGVAHAKRQAAALISTGDNITRMADVVAKPPTNKTNYLLGYEPQWSDIASGRAVTRTFDEDLGASLRLELRRAGHVSVVTGTAGSGKSTALMRAAFGLAQDGFHTAYVAADAEVSVGQLREIASTLDALVIDDVDRYGRNDWPTFVADFLSQISCIGADCSRRHVPTGTLGRSRARQL